MAAPETPAAATVSAPPLAAAWMPIPPAPFAETAPDAATETSPVPLPTALIPAALPATAAAVIVRFPPLAFETRP